jgi:hypothetical protein
MHLRYVSKTTIVLAGAAAFSLAFLLQPGSSSPVPDPNCQHVVIQPHRASAYTYPAIQCGDLKAPPPGDMWAEIGTRTRHINAVPVPIASPTPTT